MSKLLDEIDQLDAATNALIISMERRIDGLQRAYEAKSELVRQLQEGPENTRAVRARVYKSVGGALAFLVTADEGEIRLPEPSGRYEWMTDEFDIFVYSPHEEHPLCREHAQLGMGA